MMQCKLVVTIYMETARIQSMCSQYTDHFINLKVSYYGRLAALLRKKKKTTTTKNYLGLGTRNRNSFVSLKAHRFMTRNKRRTIDLSVLVPSRQRDKRSVSPLSLQTRVKFLK